MRKVKKDKNQIILTRNTKVSELKEIYGIELSVDPNTKLGDYLREGGFPSLVDMMVEGDK